jgi:gamma-glutamyltranspeptidase / glutathione hydrolase
MTVARDSRPGRPQREKQVRRNGVLTAGRLLRAMAGLVLALAVAACTTVRYVDEITGESVPPEGQPGHVSGFLGGVVSDEPQATLIGRRVLSAGGDAADAAVAVGLTLAVTLPSRAGLGGGGACLAYQPSRDSPNRGVPEAVIFVPLAPPKLPVGADRPAAVPMLARGLYLLQATYGHLPFEQLMLPAENLARTGAATSRAFADDLRIAAGPLFADPQARAVFSHDGQPLSVGDRYTQPELAATLARMRLDGVGDFYRGALARRIEEGSRLAGGPLTITELADGLPRLAPAIDLGQGRDMVAFLPPPADGGLAAAAAFKILAQDPTALVSAQARAQEVAVAWRNSSGNPQALLSAEAPAASLPPLPATTTFLTLDRNGGAVACSLSMDNLFGTGRMVPGMGFLLAASPRDVPLPLLAAALAWSQRRHAFRAEAAGSGQGAAALAVAEAMNNALRSREPMPVPGPEPGRANVIACYDYLPGEKSSCGFVADPRGTGLATGGQ